MQIDWLTVAAQIVNFLVLVWLLQRFLYRPITDAMQKREARIEERLSEARATRNQAKEERKDLQEERKALEQSREQQMEQARKDAEKLRDRLEADIREDMEKKRKTWHKQLQSEKDDFTRALQKRAGHQSIDIARNLLRDYANSDLTGQVADVFIEKLQDLDDAVRKKLSEAASETSKPALVESGDELNATARRNITRALHETLATDLDVHYREDAQIFLGIRLTIGAQTLEWSAAHHLKSLENTLDEILETTRQSAE